MSEEGHTSLIDLLDLLRLSERALDDALGNLDSDGDLTAAECMVLALLSTSSGRLPSDLSRISGLSRGRITQLADNLIERGLVSRRGDREDRRKVFLVLTPEGRQSAKGAEKHMKDLEMKVRKAMGTAGMDMLAQHLRQLSDTCKED